MAKMNKELVSKTVDIYLQQGVLGASVIVLLVAVVVLLSFILKDKKHQKQLADAISKTAVNQEKFVIMYQESQKQHKEIINILNETLEIERRNTKECYINVANKLDTLSHKHDHLLSVIRK